MIFLAPFQNLDLLAVGIATAATGILTFAVFLSNKKSATSQAFLLLGLLTIMYSIVNYLSSQFASAELVLWLLRLTLCFSVLHAFSFFRLFYVFPREDAEFPKSWGPLLVTAVILVALFTLTPFVFVRIDQLAPVGHTTNPVRAPGIAVFGLMVVLLVLGGLYFLIKKFFAARGMERRQFEFVVLGAGITFSSLILFNYILPVYFNELNLVPLAPVFFFPFIILTAYAIVRHHLLSIKVISTEILAFVLTIVTFSDVIFSQDLPQTLFRTGEFILVFIYSLLLIKSVLREVEQREELERLNAQIQEKNKQLEDLGRFKSELLSLASHQIRSPLGAMKGFISLIVGGTYGQVGDKVKETLGKVQKSADELIGLINTLLDVRKVEEGKMEYQFDKTDLSRIVSDVVDLMKPVAEAKKLELTLDLPASDLFVSADAEKLKQVIQNLTDNAIKYTPSGFVHLEMELDKSNVLVNISDSGLGIPATLIPYLFEEFIRDERVKKEIRGTGLGLYIARKIVEAHGGKIWAESAGEGKGSTFHISVPKLKETQYVIPKESIATK